MNPEPESGNFSGAARAFLAAVGAVFFFVAYEIRGAVESWNPVSAYFVTFVLLGVLMVLKALRYRGRMFTTTERTLLLYMTLAITGLMLVLVLGTLHEIVGPDARYSWQFYVMTEYVPVPGLLLDFFLLFYIASVAKGTATVESSPSKATQNNQRHGYDSRAFLPLLPFLFVALSLLLWTYIYQSSQ